MRKHTFADAVAEVKASREYGEKTDRLKKQESELEGKLLKILNSLYLSELGKIKEAYKLGEKTGYENKEREEMKA